MTDALVYVLAGATIGIPAIFLALAIRHFIPLMRGYKAPWWAGMLGPFAFTDRFVDEAARRHRKKCLLYTLSFVAWCSMLVVVLGAVK
jgi:hypothetical protein